MIEQIPKDEELRRNWNQLALQMEPPEVFYTFEWAVSVQRAYAGSITPLVFLAYEGERLVGVAPLARKISGEIVFLTADTGDYCDFLSAPDLRTEFVAAVLLELKRREAHKIVLTNLPADSATAKALFSIPAGVGYRPHIRPAYACARVVLGFGEERAVLKQTVLAKKRLRRNMREMQKRGQVRIVHETEADKIEPLLEPFSHAHIARFLETGKISALVREERRVFLRELTREAGKSGWVAINRLLVGDVTAAWHYGFRFAGSWFWYQPTVNRSYGDFSPGYCLLAKIIELACDSPEFKVVDLGLGAEGYKERFATATRQTLYCELNSSLPRHVRAVLRYRAASITTASPKVEGAIRGTIAHISGVSARLASRGAGQLFRASVRRLKNAISSSENVLFFEWPLQAKGLAISATKLCQLDADVLGASAMRYANDSDALQYLMRSAQRFDSGNAEGFVLIDAGDVPVHFCWAKDFEGFHMAELNRTLQAPGSGATMIFDCYTPASARGRGYFSEAVTLLANHLQSRGKNAWIFGADTNLASLQGIRKTAFDYRFTLGRTITFFFKTAKGSVPKTLPSKAQDLNAVSNEPSGVSS